MAASRRSSGLDEAFIVERLYEAALQPDLLPEALHIYARALNGSIGHALYLDTDGTRLIVSSDGREGAQAYVRDWWKHDVATQRGQARQLKGAVNTFDLTTPEERASLPFYQEFTKEFDCFWSCAHIFRRPGATPMVVGVRRPESHGPFNRAEMEKLDRLGRHVARAIEISTRLGAASVQNSGFCQALTHFGHGVIGISERGRVLFANEAIETVRGDGLFVSNGAVLATMVSRQAKLNALISKTLARANLSTLQPTPPLALPRPSGRAPLVVYGFSVSVDQSAFMAPLGGQPKAMLLVIEPDKGRFLDEQLLQEMFGLTRAEARVASAVARGKTPRQASTEFGIREGSFRTQLKSVFHKTGVQRQAELVLLLAPLLTGSITHRT